MRNHSTASKVRGKCFSKCLKKKRAVSSPGTSGSIYGWTEVMAAQMPQRAIVNGSTPIVNAAVAL
jgi:hypothetical protein